MSCGEAESWLSPCLRCSDSTLRRSSGEILEKFWRSMFNKKAGSPQKQHKSAFPHGVSEKALLRAEEPSKSDLSERKIGGWRGVSADGLQDNTNNDNSNDNE